MTRLHIRRADLDTIVAHAQRGAPAEVCGLIGGRRQRDDLYAARVLPIRNASTTPHTHFDMARPALVRALFALLDAGLEVVGIYHSHPTSEPEPSLTDINESTWPDIAYLIVGFAALPDPKIGVWAIHDKRALPVELHPLP